MARNQYRIAFNNEVNDKFYLYITPDDGILNTIDLTARRGTILLTSSFNDDSKIFSGVVSKEITFDFQFDVDIRTQLESFLDGTFGLDFTDWKVSLYRNDETRPFFQGYLSLESNSQSLMNRRDRVSLRATDGLSALKGIDFNSDGTLYDGKNTPLYYIAQALGKLNLPDIRLRTIWNITHVLMDTNLNSLDQVNIQAKLFGEKEALDCYEALTLICKNFKCRIYQESGFFWIDSLADRMNVDYFKYFEYTIGSLGEYTQTSTGSLYLIQDIGHNKPVKLAGADAIKYIQMPKRLVELTFNYRYPAKPFCNSDFKDYGALIPYEDSPPGGAYDATCWTHELPPYSSPGVPTMRSFITNNLDDAGDVLDQSLYIESESGFAPYSKSPLFEIGAGDVLEFSVSAAARVDTGDETGTLTNLYVIIFLIGDNGDYYTLDDDGVWNASNASLSVGVQYLQHTYVAGENKADPVTLSVKSDRVPVTGRIEVILNNPLPFIGGSPPIQQAIIYKDLTITVEPRSGGKELKGDTNKVTQTHKQQGEIKETVDISDLPTGKRYIMGGLYKLAPNDREEYYPQWDFMGAFTTKQRFTGYMAQLLAKYTKRSYVRIEGGLKYYMTNVNGEHITLGFLPRYRFTDYDTDKEFMLTGQYSLDLTRGTWRGVFVEVKEAVTLTESSGGTYEFDYITE